MYMQVHTICRRVIVSTLIVLLAILVFEPRAMSEDHTEGFPPLDRVRLTMPEEQVPLLMKVLQQFAEDESLKTAKGEFQRDGREVYQLTLRLDDGTFFFMSNFRNKQHFEMTAYSHAAPSIWKPIWLRLVDRLTQTLGPDAIHRDMDPHSPKS
jgi:hypothetical protein